MLKSSSELNPRTTSYEFLGPPGALLITLALALIPARVSAALSDPAWWNGLWDTQAALLYLAWYAFCLVAWAVLPGDRVLGTTLRTGEKKQYKINAFSTFLLTLGLTCGSIYRYGPQSFTFINEKFVGFITASVIMSVVQGVAFFIGRELNPMSIGSFDLKTFNELRPGLILWTLIDISMVCEQATRRGGLGQVTDSLWARPALPWIVCSDALYNEPGIFTQMDITTDGFGFMLAVGDLAWVPFVYCLQARYLVFNPIELGPIWATTIVLFNMAGYYIFRTANAEKNDFRNGKNPKNLEFFTTESGHPNYFGDLLMALAWSFPTAFSTPVTYFYVIYFTGLLMHRQRRDDENCEKKLEEIHEDVPYRIIPYVY
ncbi:ergosterol biosynthesis ERG4/ERG24 family-domain-containing protein [Mycena sp. CBHHK59/15]|nr:ergosterol biosynthesis ERG4/ERG24 family-domain-containing protein [Mycena sp. CBHHK59/15]